MNKALVKEKLKKLSVLFVDDEKLVTDTMKDILPMIFDKTYYAEDGYEGLQKYMNHYPDMVITDLSMPHLDGLSMIRQIRKINKDTKIICISGHNEQRSIDDCKTLDCGYLVKPINSKVLFDVFENVLNTSA
jgi:YesN/AraC family two-component response regulator